jgi:hypothetical protein
MHRHLEKIEEIVDKLILPSLIVVLFIVITGLFFRDFYLEYKNVIGLLDDTIIGIFVIDLGFKTYRANDWENFLKEHWLEIIAVMPAFLFYRLIEGISIAIEYVEKSQHIGHLLEGLRSGRFTALVRSGGLTRSERLAKFIRPLSRSPRLAKATEFYESPNHHSLFSSKNNSK